MHPAIHPRPGKLAGTAEVASPLAKRLREACSAQDNRHWTSAGVHHDQHDGIYVCMYVCMYVCIDLSLSLSLSLSIRSPETFDDPCQARMAA